ncbi:HNH endonuclease, partial [Salmonella enterica subsp. enterica serovar Hadar]|nr:HNH endonuclease [Salmonella enterica subsp. enterica serovar Hadar]EBW5829335.1 HNH endonuclease [Salmonella enterica subsp. enterica serovar Hadar]EFB3705232.1 HNH endonuclease [Escherichia coli]
MKEIKLTPEMVLSVVDYNPSSGDFHWR